MGQEKKKHCHFSHTPNTHQNIGKEHKLKKEKRKCLLLFSPWVNQTLRNCQTIKTGPTHHQF